MAPKDLLPGSLRQFYTFIVFCSHSLFIFLTTGTLDPLYGTCGSGHQQSPIDIEVGAPYVHLQSKHFASLSYAPLRNVFCGYNGHAVQCDWNSTATSTSHAQAIKIKNKVYDLIQFHFHSPSEHRINNHFADAELHLVHQHKPSGSLAVVGILLEVQEKANPLFDWITALDKEVDLAEKGHGFLAKHEKTGLEVQGKEQIKYKVHKVDFEELLKATNAFTPRWEYEGSLTTPPCTEGVAWNVVQTSVGLGLKQFDALVDLEGYNSRFLQDRPDEKKH